MQPGGYMQDLGPIRDSNVTAPSNDPGRYSSTGGISRAALPEHRLDTVSALAGARQMVLRYHEEYLIVQALQFISPHFRVLTCNPRRAVISEASLCSPASSYNAWRA